MRPRFFDTSLRRDGACRGYLPEDHDHDIPGNNTARFLHRVDSLFVWPEYNDTINQINLCI